MRKSLVWLIALTGLVAHTKCFSGECGLGFTEVGPNDPQTYCAVSIKGQGIAARKFILQGQTDIAMVRLRLARRSGTGWVTVEYRQDVNGSPGITAYHRAHTIGANGISTTPTWYEFDGLNTIEPAGTYWIAVYVQSGDAEVDWIGLPENKCGTIDDNKTYENRQWRATQMELNFEVVCKECPVLSDGSVSPTFMKDNSVQTYTYRVKYRNGANIAPATAQVIIDGTAHDMQAESQNPDYQAGVWYKYDHTNVRLGVGTHKYEFSFSTAAGKSAKLSYTGPTVNPGYPKTGSIEVTPNPVKTNQQVTLKGTGSDPDGSIARYLWRLVNQETNEEKNISTILSNYQQNAGLIGEGLWKVFLKVKDDEGYESEEKLYATASGSAILLQIVDAEAPEVTACTATIDGLSSSGEEDKIGVFIPGLGLQVENKFQATVVDCGGGIAKVVFDFPHRTLGRTTITATSAPYEATFNMDGLPDGGGELKITAYSKGVPSKPGNTKVITLVTTSRPPWWGGHWITEQWASWKPDPSSGHPYYTFRCKLPPGLEKSYDILTNSLFGTLQNHYQSDIEVVEHFYPDGQGSSKYWDYRATGILDVTALSVQLEHQEYPAEVVERGAGRPAYGRNLAYYEWPLYECTPFEYSLEGPSYDYRGIIMAGPVPVEYHAGLSTEIGFEIKFTVDGLLFDTVGKRPWDDKCYFASLRFTPTTDFTVEFDMFIEIYEGLAKLGFKATPEMCLDLPLTAQFGWPPPPPDLPAVNLRFDPCLQFWVNYVVYGSVAWGLLEGDLYSGQYPDPPFKYPENCYGVNCGEEACAEMKQSEERNGLFAAPTIASDKHNNGGSSVCVWVHDADEQPDEVDPELYYSYYPTLQGQWSAPAPVFAQNNHRFETDPKVIYTGLDTVMLVWTQNELDKATLEGGRYNYIPDILAEQELYYVTGSYNPFTKTWTWHGPAAKLTNDALPAMNPQFPQKCGDGLVKLGADEGSGKAIAVWVRETDHNSSTRNDWDIYHAIWNGAAWSAPALLPALPIGDNTADVQPDAAMDSNGNIMVVWIRDTDSDFTTNENRYVAHSTYNKGTQSWGPMTVEQTWPVGALSPSVTFDLANQPVLVFTSRGNNSKQQPLQEGPSGRLFAACFRGGAPSISPVGEAPTGPRALEPKVRCNFQNETIAIWRGFKAVGPHGFDGQVSINLRYAGLPTCTNWGNTAYLTDDEVTTWQIDFDVDRANIVHVVRVTEGGSLESQDFGGGFDGIHLTNVLPGPDISVNSSEIVFSNNLPGNGEPVTIRTLIHNTGNSRAFGVNVDFRTEAGLIGSQQIGVLEPQTSVELTQTWVSDGQAHIIQVIADPTNVIIEVDEGNNTGTKQIGVPQAPALLKAYPSAAPIGIMLTWTSTAGAKKYLVFRATEPGGSRVTLGEAWETSFLDDTAALNKRYYYVVRAIGTGGQQSPDSNEASATLGPDYDNDGIPDFADPDDDNDGMPDAWETANNLDPLDASDAGEDPDQDGFTNLQEYEAGTDPHNPDSHPDITPPSRPVVSAAPYTASTSQLSASWTCSDDYSGITEYRYVIGTTPGGCEVRGWTSNGTWNTLTATGLTLAHGQTYYISVYAIDGAGLESEIGTSPGVKVDTTTPVMTSKPTVRAWSSEESISASWSATDEESGISEYEYSIGTAVGATDVVGWTTVGRAVEVSHTGLTLENGRLYYVNVRATNGAGLQTTSTSEPTRAVRVLDTIAEALELTNETWTALSTKAVTGAIGNYAWIEESDFSAAVRVNAGSSLEEGQRVTVVGRMTTPVYTRQIAAEVVKVESSGEILKPLGIKNISIGGSARNAETRGVDGGFGLNNVCMLVTTWGEVTSVGSNYFYIDDGSALLDGTGNRGIRVDASGLAKPSVGAHVLVTGLVNASRLEPSGASIRLLIPRKQSDICDLSGGLVGASNREKLLHEIDRVKQ